MKRAGRHCSPQSGETYVYTLTYVPYIHVQPSNRPCVCQTLIQSTSHTCVLWQAQPLCVPNSLTFSLLFFHCRLKVIILLRPVRTNTTTGQTTAATPPPPPQGGDQGMLTQQKKRDCVCLFSGYCPTVVTHSWLLRVTVQRTKRLIVLVQDGILRSWRLLLILCYII